MDYIETNITLWHITIMFNSGDMNEQKNKRLPKTKAFKDTLQKVTNVSNRWTVLLSAWIINLRTKTNLQQTLINAYEHREILVNSTRTDI